MNDETRMTLRLPNDLKTMLANEAKVQNRSIHNLIITILRSYFSSEKADG